MKHKFVVTALVSILALAGCKVSVTKVEPTTQPKPAATTAPGGSSNSTGGTNYSGNGVSFSYPNAWQDITVSGTSAQTSSSDWSKTVGATNIDLVIVSQYTIPTAITTSNIAASEPGIKNTISDLFTKAGGAVTSGPSESSMGGFPSLEFTGLAKAPDGTPVSSKLVLAFDGTTEYFVNCQYTTEHSAEILEGCDQIVSSFQQA